MPNAKIAASAKYVPEFIVENDKLSQIVETSDEWIQSRTGIRSRRISLTENTSDLCVKVFDQLMINSGLTAKDVQVIIVATSTPDMLSPTTSCIVQSKTNATNAFCFDIGAGCSGFVYALSVGEKYIRSGYTNIVVIGADILSKITDWSDRSTCVLFADGAGGVLLQASEGEGIMAEDIHSGSHVFAIKGYNFPLTNPFLESTEVVSPFLQMDGRAVFEFAMREVPMSINAVLTKTGLSIDEISYIVPHQANYRIVEAIAKKLKLPMDKFFTNMDKYGNTSAASIPIALSEMLESKISIGCGQKLILCGFGSGLTWGSILLTI